MNILPFNLDLTAHKKLCLMESCKIYFEPKSCKNTILGLNFIKQNLNLF